MGHHRHYYGGGNVCVCVKQRLFLSNYTDSSLWGLFLLNLLQWHGSWQLYKYVGVILIGICKVVKVLKRYDEANQLEDDDDDNAKHDKDT